MTPQTSAQRGWLSTVRALLRRTETRFLIVGAWNTLFGYLAFLAVYALADGHLSHAMVLTIAYAISVVQSFVMQRMFVFGTEGHPGRQLFRFVLVNTVIFVSNLIFLPLATRATGLPVPLVQAVFVFGSTVISYLAHKLYSFAR